MNPDFELASRLFEERAIDVPKIGRVELDPGIVSREQACVRGVVLHINGVAHEFEGGPDAWSAVSAALVELTKPDATQRMT